MSYIFAGMSHRTQTELHDAIAHAWIGAGGSPSIQTIDEVLSDFDTEIVELEREWAMTPEHDYKAQEDGRDGGQDGYERGMMKDAIVRLREEIEAEAADEDEDEEVFVTSRHIMVTVRCESGDGEDANGDGIRSQDDYSVADQEALYSLAARLSSEAESDVQAGFYGKGKFRVMVIDYTADPDHGNDLFDEIVEA